MCSSVAAFVVATDFKIEDVDVHTLLTVLGSLYACK